MPKQKKAGVEFPARVVLVHDKAALDGDAAARDVLDQLDAVEAALHRLGSGSSRIAVDLDLAGLKQEIARRRPDCAFNLVESLDGSDRLQTIVPMLFEDWRLPFTGSDSTAMLLANQKIEAKRLLADQSLPFPGCAWLAPGGELRLLSGAGETTGGARDWIVKARDSHASVFLDDASVLRGADAATLAKRLAEARAEHGQPFFAERFIDGREFNLSILESAEGVPEVLPAAEISFAALDPARLRIVGYAAKWDEASYEYQATPRVFPTDPADRALLEKLSETALAVWQALGLAGYARVDFRVDRAGNPYILEANANPCLTPGAGFAAASEQAGIGYDEMIRRIVLAGLRKG